VSCACASMRGYGCGSVVVVGPVWLRGYASKVVWLCRYGDLVMRVRLCGCAGMTGCAGMVVWLWRYDCMCRYVCVVVPV